ncbi:MAG: GGDEF domain-containing protein [bacterium]|nr:GGDEF domain-containing protein [bacterium]
MTSPVAVNSRTLWILGLGALGSLAFVLLPNESAVAPIVYHAVSIGAIVMLLLGILRMPRSARTAWWAMLAFVVLSAAGDVIYDIEVYFHDSPPYPSAADIFYLLAYAFAFVALVILIRKVHRGRDLEAWIDTLILTIATASVVAVFIIEPGASSRTTTGAATVIAVVYPLLDVAMLSGLIRLLTSRVRINTAIALLSTAFAVTFIADLAFNYIAATGLDGSAPRGLDALFLVAFVIGAAAANAPGAATIADHADTSPDSIRPLRMAGFAIGALTVPVILVYLTWSSTDHDARILACACLLVLALVLWRVQLLLLLVQGQATRLASQARLDSLTGLPNRRTLDVELESVESYTRDAGVPLTVAMMDLDNFKEFNDVQGHQRGDEALRSCAAAWRFTLGDAGLLARYGGEEFVVLLPGHGLSSAQPVLEQVRRSTPDGHTVSIGFAERRPGETGFDTMSRADRALYRAKRMGRDRVMAYRADDISPTA